MATRNLYLDFFTFLYHYIAYVKSDSVSWEVLVQLIPLHSLHPIEQSMPCFLHVQRFVSQFSLQLHLTIFSKLSRAAGRSVFFGSNLFCTIDHPNLLLVVYCQFLSITAPDGKHAYCGTLQPRMLVAEFILVQMMSLS